MSASIVFEACVDSVEAAMAAQEGGADRVELCADLLEGGVTPSAGTIRLTCQRLSIPVHVLIRPRGGDFCYSAAEFEVMRLDVEQVRELGADGVVFGLLTPDGSVDRQRTEALIEAARPLRVTFHRAFDMASDASDALDMLVALGVERVLTSGQEETALEGAELIAALVQRAGARIVVMAGGGINERNVGRIVAQTRVREVHATVRARVDSRMEYRNTHCSMGCRATFTPESQSPRNQQLTEKTQKPADTKLSAGVTPVYASGQFCEWLVFTLLPEWLANSWLPRTAKDVRYCL